MEIKTHKSEVLFSSPSGRSGGAFDAIDLSVLWSRLISIVDEAGTTLQRTAFSTVTRESADFAVVLMDTHGHSLAQSSVSVPSFLGVLPFLVKELVKNHFPLNTWKEGDVVITNDPWMCAGHKPDIGIVSPIFSPPKPSQREGFKKGLSTKEICAKYGYETADPLYYGLIKEFSERHKANPTEAEKTLWQCLKGKKLEDYKFRRQHIILNFIADFVCLKKKLIIEVDGSIHQLPEVKLNDIQRTEILENEGYKIIRFTNNEVLSNIEAVLIKITNALSERNDVQAKNQETNEVLPFGEDLGGALIGFIGCIAHSPDIGGTLWGAGAKDFYEEGLYIPPSKLYDAGVKNDLLFKIIETNVRAANQTIGDILAQVAANDQGIRSLHRMMEENNLTEINPLGKQIIAASEKAMRNAISQAPNGTFHSEYNADGDGIKEPVHFKCAVTIKDDEIFVDYTGTSAAHSLAINAVMNYVFAYTAYPIKCIFSPEVPNNEGSFRPIHVFAPEGSLLNAKKPSPLGARNVTGNLLHGPIMKALSQAVPDKVQADCGAAVWVMVLSGKREDNSEFVEYLFLAGGYGGRNGLDGEPTLCYPTNVANVPIEVFENDAPVLVTEKSLILNSGGKGKYKGGNGQRFAYKNIGTKPIQISNVSEKLNTSAYGLFGGGEGKKGKLFIRTVLGKKRFTPPKGHDKLFPGEELVMELPGGGGYGKN